MHADVYINAAADEAGRRRLIRGYEAIPKLLAKAQLDVVFAMIGGTNAPWIAHGVATETLRLVRVRHEDTAVGAAGGYSRATGRIGVASLTRGPGFANAVNALVAAAQSHVPVLLLTGQSPTAKRPSMQNVDQEGISRAAGAGFHHIADRSDLEQVFWEAIEGCRHDGQPQVVSVGDGILNADGPPLGDAWRRTPRTGADEQSVASAVDLLETARHPVIIAGTGAILAGCRDQLVELAQLTGAHLATTLRALHLFANHRHDLGLAGGWAPGPNRKTFAACDLVLAVGASMNDYTTDLGNLTPDAPLVHCDVDPSAIGESSLALVGDARETARALVGEWRRRGLAERPSPRAAAPHSSIVESALAVDLGHDLSRGLDPRTVYVTIDRALPDDRVVVTDSGRFLGTAASLISASDPESWLVGNSFGSIGQGLSTAIGAAAAHRGRPLVLITGDGGFMTSSHDLDAVRLNGLDLTIVVINDEMYGSDAKYLTDVGLPLDVITQQLPDIPKLAEAFGGSGEVVTSLEQLEGVGRDRGLRILDVRVDPLVNVREVTRAWSRDGGPEPH